jgi:hypothetical protein
MMANIEPRTKGCNNDAPNRFRFGAVQKPREESKGRMGESDIIAAHPDSG